MIKQNYDKILLGIALIVLAGAVLIVAIRPEGRSVAEVVDFVVPGPGNTYEVSELSEPDFAIPEWEQPGPQSAGEEWEFDLFTPPNINYNPRSRTFVVRGVDPPSPEPFGIQLVGLEERLYRIQLVGFHPGRQDDFLLNLRDEEGRRDILARQGRDYPELEISVRDVRVETRQYEHGGETAVTERVARAVIFDHRLGEEVVLFSDRRKMAEGRSARFRVTLEGHEGKEELVREGESFEIEDFTYEVIELNASTATVIRESRDPDAPRRTETLGARTVERVSDEDPEADAEDPDSSSANGEEPPPANGTPTEEEDPSDGEFAF